MYGTPSQQCIWRELLHLCRKKNNKIVLVIMNTIFVYLLVIEILVAATTQEN